jgi:hypothetical protein
VLADHDANSRRQFWLPISLYPVHLILHRD